MSTTASAATTEFLYDGDSLVAEYSGGGTLLRRYVHGPGVDEPIVWYEGAGLSDRRNLISGQGGSVIAEVGLTTIRYTYGPYGEPDVWTGLRLRYAGQMILPEAELYHYRARVYDPLLGRFLQADPVGYEDDLNPYAYARNDPIDFFDPNGQEVEANYYRDAGLLQVTDRDTGETRWATNGFSGGWVRGWYGGPVPEGGYAILFHPNEDGRFRLERYDDNFGDDRTPEGRSEIRLHLGTMSLGCITLERNSCNASVLEFIRDTRTTTATIRRGGLGGLLGATEETTSYGYLRVHAQSGFRFNQRTGEVTFEYEYYRTGTRIPEIVEEPVCTIREDGSCE